MSAPPAEHDRLLVPRWRETAKLVLQVEAKALPGGTAPEVDAGEVAQAHAEWLDRPSIELASDVLISAAATGTGEWLAFGPAEQVLQERENVAPALVDLAQRLRHAAGPILTEQTTVPALESKDVLHRELHRVRASVREYARNPFAWLDLALLHTRLGHADASEKAARTSLGLAPNNRLVVRSIARLLLHQSDPEEALRIVRGSELTRFDPWLTGVEISLSDLVGRSPRFRREAYDLVKRFQGEPAVVSELAASIGTNEALHGPLRRARQYFRLALKRPTENVIAQANWMSTKMPGAVDFDGNRLLKQESVYEARALSAYHEGRWTDVLAEAELWLADESFSSRPAITASFVAASMLGDFGQAERFASLGLIANPRDESLRNNLAFALASGDQPERALAVVAEFPTSTAYQQVFFVATAALLEMRLGRVEEGRKAYIKAIEFADRLPPGPALLARYHYAMAELQTASPDYDCVLARLRECRRLKVKRGVELSAIRGLEARIANLIMQPKIDKSGRRAELLSATDDKQPL